MPKKYQVKDINWKGHKEEFLSVKFSELTRGERTKFLRSKDWQYRDVPICEKCNHVYFNCICRNPVALERLRTRKAEMKKPFEEKLEYSRNLVEKVLKELKGETIYLAYSGGFDSECCLQLFKESIIDGRVKVIFGDTLVNYPASYDRINAAEKELGIKILHARPAPGVSFKKIIEKYGLPLYTRGSDSSLKEARATNVCCESLKKKPMRDATKKVHIILGLKASENQYRRFSILRWGDFHKSKETEKYKILPIAYWNLEDEWKYQKLLGFNYNTLYDKKLTLADGREYKPRTGCWCCPQPSYAPGHLCWLKRYYPRHYKILMDKYGLKNHVTIRNIKGREYLVKKKRGEKGTYKPCTSVAEVFFGDVESV